MRTLRSLFALPSWGLLLAGLLAAQPAAAAVNNLTVVVPRKPLPQLQIGQIVVTVQVDTEAAIGFTVTPPTGVAQGTGNLTPGPAPAGVNLLFGADLVQVMPPDTTGLGASDPRRRNYRFVLTPASDFGANCETVMGGNETWTIAVTGGASRITDACSVSFDENIGGNQCNGTLRVVPNGEPFAELGGISSQEQTCRFGLDAMLVLDRSGSMGWEARPADPPGPSNVRIVSLRNAVASFVSTLTTVRSTETTNFGTAPTDNVGVVIFNQNAADLPGLAAGLNTFNAATPTAINTGIGGTAPSGSTSIGDGVFAADAYLGGAAAANRRRVILLMSDGQQNTDRLLGADVAASRVFTHPPGTACPPGDVSCVDLANLGTYQIYAVTVGLGVGPAAEQLNQDVALATGGFYLNSEDDAGELTAFFGGLLQNFLETATWQTVLSGFDSADPATPFTVRVPITSTSQAVAVTLTPRAAGRGFCLRVTPPGAPPRPPVCGTGVLSTSVTPADIARHLGGNWEIEVEARVAPQEFHLLVLADDMGTGARVVTSSASHAPGDPIRVEARLSDLGGPIVGLDPNRLRVTLASPTTTIGELLATSGAGTSLPTPDDGAIDAANAKVQNEVERNPAALAMTTGGVSLRDDGTGGDRTAGDGIYSAEFMVTQYGNVDLLVTLAGTSAGGAFLRQKNETVHLRAIPDGTATEVSTQVASTADGRQLVIQVVPKTRFGFRIGPGWGNYLWFTTPTGQTIKPRDNLDGSYTARVPFSGSTSPAVDLHVLTDSVVITDLVPPEKLPQPLDDSNVLVADIRGQVPPAPRPWSLSAHAGLSEPEGNFRRPCDGGVGWGLDVEYLFTSALAAELFYGRDTIDCGVFDVFESQRDLQHLALNGKIYFGPAVPRFFVVGGVGSYDLDDGTDIGVAIGLGAQFNPLARLGFELTAKYHRIETSPFDLDLATLQFGLRFRL
jgi:hypothetical protein